MRILFMLCLLTQTAKAQLTELTVEKIMRDPKWIGTSPSNIRWSVDSKTVYFNWNPDKNPGDSLYKITLNNFTPQKVTKAERLSLPTTGVYNNAYTKMVYDKDGDIFLLDIPSNKTTRITATVQRESNPYFSGDEKMVVFTAEQNIYTWNIATGAFSQVTDFRRGKKPSSPPESEQQKWLRQDQLAYIQVLRERKEKRDASDKHRKTEEPKRPKEIYLDDKNIGQQRLSPDGRYVTFVLTKSATAKNTIVPNYVTESGFTEDITARTKVGAPQNMQELYVYDIARDTVLQFKTDELPGIFEKPSYLNNKEESKDKKPQPRAVNYFGISWSPDGKQAVMQLRAQDNKDRWIVRVDVASAKLIPIDRQHDEAWIGGPGGFSLGWVNNQEIWFVSEESGYAHLYTFHTGTQVKRALTGGNYEVQQVMLSRDRKHFYLITNEVHPGEKHLYRLAVTGGKAERLTYLTGAHEPELSPDEKWIAFRYSYSNKPWELYLMENPPAGKPVKTEGKARQITQSLTDEFQSYPWRDPVVTTFKARDGADVYARLYKPAQPNGAAVIFVHGAGYLQNAHKWWSSYFREYMFHNLLADKGYTVLDIDYRASAGYGRDWRTAIYQHMGGKDLNDHVDGAAWLVKEHGIDPKRIGIYGGSYGGFITLMAMFTTPDVFAAGAALRPVTDWAHYNHPYTSNILNLPYTDSLAYAKSSPIYHAEGLKGALLICHGMIDVNVHFQDVVRLAQRLIELGKDNWELAVYPLEDHGFVEPSSWTDEYKRILRLFETHLR
ncbi:MAG: prolyl oligopeptidase family serine peptidase [Cyclobacteriaceae bacterium]|nr:prolyl oligopeptidase family serine peptidase [Cyclobacteriaceae bacterium]